jgi:hypothetical protein
MTATSNNPVIQALEQRKAELQASFKATMDQLNEAWTKAEGSINLAILDATNLESLVAKTMHGLSNLNAELEQFNGQGK